ncbi:hypothetical protein HPP92_018271 [Vanilla planifolia]|uniref:Uncharacterized protein n=1 Tax=Vanilla planifolia TaxID=51239 RepID=A0A835QCN0_VANPL|nr:hypothetical protein HPP92_018271 [Vanilla planifolia]
MPLLESFGVYDSTSSVDVVAFCSSMEVCPINASKVAEGLGLVGYSFQDWPCNMRLNAYHLKEESIGCQVVHAHTDSSLVTLLFEGEIGGVEITDENGKFVAVDSE